jgi:hypothetical protein
MNSLFPLGDSLVRVEQKSTSLSRQQRINSGKSQTNTMVSRFQFRIHFVELYEGDNIHFHACFRVSKLVNDLTIGNDSVR